MNPRPGLMTDFSLNWFCHLLFQGSPLHHCPKGTKSISAFIHLFQAWVCSSCNVSDPMAGHRPNSTQRSRPRPTSQQLQEKGLAGRKPEAEGKGKPGALMVRTIPPFSSSLIQFFFPSSSVHRAVEQQYFTCVLQRLEKDPWSSHSPRAGLFSTIKGLEETPNTTALTLDVLSILTLIISPAQISRSVVSDSLRPHESQHARPPCPSPTPRLHSDSRPSSQ